MGLVTALGAAVALVAYRLSEALYPLFWARPSLIAGNASVLAPAGAIGIVVSTLLAYFGLLLAESCLRHRVLGRPIAFCLAESGRTNAPACLLLPCLLLLVPGAPGVPPLAMWLALDARHWLASLAVLGCLWLKLGGRFSARVAPAFATTLLALLLLGLTPRHRFTQLYDERFGTGDEPRYVRIAASLLYDRDTDISNASDHLHGPFSTERAERPREIRIGGEARSLGGQVVAGRRGGAYYVYLPGFPLLLVPAMAIDSIVAPHHLWTVMSFCILLGVVNALFLSRLVERALPGGKGGLALASALALTPPLLAYSFQLYPEVAASICVSASMIVILRGPAPPGRWEAAGFAAATALLPWLHTKYYPLWGVLLGAFLLRFRRLPKKRLALVLSAPVLSVGLQSLYVFQIAGSPLPDALWVLNGYPRGATLFNRQTLSGLYYLFLGRSEGLLVYAPQYLLGLLGFAALWKWNRFALWLSLLLFVPYVLVAASHDQGGAGAWSPPSRYFVPVIPVLALGLAAWLRARPSAARKGALLVLLLASFWVGLGMLEERNFLYDRDAFRASGAVDPSPVLSVYPALLGAAVLLFHAFESGWMRSSLFPALSFALLIAAGHLALRWSPPESWTPARPSMQGRLIRPARSELFLFRDCAEPSLRGLAQAVPAGEFVQWTRGERIEWKLLRARAPEGTESTRVEPVCP